MSAKLNSLLLSSADPARLHAWYAAAFEPAENDEMGGYRVLGFDGFYVMFDQRDDVGDRAPEPGRIILNLEVDDAPGVVARMDELGAGWLAELEDREGSYFATAIDPDGNYVQVIQMSEEAKAAMSAAGSGAADRS